MVTPSPGAVPITVWHDLLHMEMKRCEHGPGWVRREGAHRDELRPVCVWEWGCFCISIAQHFNRILQCGADFQRAGPALQRGRAREEGACPT